MFIAIIWITFFQTEAELRPKLNLVKQQLQAAKLTLQPIVVFVGALVNVEAAYVVVNDILYRCDSAVHAVNLCLQIFFSLDCQYPQQAASLWTFVQAAGFDIHLQSDIRNRSLITLTNEIERQITVA